MTDCIIKAALDCLSDLRFHGHYMLDSYENGEITLEEYHGAINRYKKLRDELYSGGYLPDGWDDVFI